MADFDEDLFEGLEVRGKVIGDPRPIEQQKRVSQVDQDLFEGLEVRGIAIGRVEPPQESLGPLDYVTGAIEPAITMLTGAVAKPISGIAGLGASLAGLDEGARTVERVQEALTYTPRFKGGTAGLKASGELLEPLAKGIEKSGEFLEEKTLDLTGSEALATGMRGVPEALLDVAGIAGGGGLGKVPSLPKIKPRKPVAPTQEAVPLPQKKTPDITPEKQSYEQIADNLRKSKIAKVAEEVIPDEAIRAAAEELNIDLNPSHYSTNRAFIDMEQSLKSQPGSKLATVEEKAILDLGTRADDLIADLGGSVDKSLTDVRVSNKVGSMITRLENKADTAYSAVSEAIPKTVKVIPKASRAYLDEMLADLGGNASLLSASERHLLDVLKKNPTYAALDRIRKNVGSGFKGKGPFKDEDAGILKQVYRVLSEDQQGVSDYFGVGSDYAAARKLVSTRKDLESSAVSLFGKELTGSILPKMREAATALTKGDASKLDKLVQAVPKGSRPEVVATLLGDIFSSGARSKQGLGQGFVNAFDALNRNAVAKKALFRHLPPEALARFNKIGSVAKGIYRSKSLENTSKTARDLISAMDDGGIFAKVYSVGRKAVVAEGVSTSLGMPGAGSAAIIASTLSKAKTPATQAADTLLTSPAFKRAIDVAAKGNLPAAERIMQRSPQFKKWASYADKSTLKAIAATGFIGWLSRRESDNEGTE